MRRIHPLLTSIVVAAAAGVALADGVSVTPEQQAQMFKNAQRHVVHTLKDPDVQLQDLAISKNGAFVCGEVKAKNGIDGYPGFDRFIDANAYGRDDEGDVDIETNVDDESGDDSFADRWSEYCPKN